MATRWKSERTTEILTLHAHNQMSRYCDAVLSAADELGLIVGFARSSNHYDGSTDRTWYVPTALLDRVGGVSALKDRARALHSAALGI